MALVGYVSVLYAFLADQFLFNETISYVELLGAILILSVTVWVSVVKIRQQNKQKQLEAEKSV